MKKETMNKIIGILIVVCIALVVIFFMTKGYPKSDVQVSKCIGHNSVLYTRLGCHFCEVQQDMFGENYQYLNVMDCFFDEAKCIDISSTPTWIIKNKQYVGVQTIAKLKKLTGC